MIGHAFSVGFGCGAFISCVVFERYGAAMGLAFVLALHALVITRRIAR